MERCRPIFEVLGSRIFHSGSLGSGHAVTSAYKETSGSPHFPSYPYEHMPWSQTPVLPCTLAMSHTGLLPSAQIHAVGFLLLCRIITMTTTIHFSGLNTEPVEDPAVFSGASLIPSSFRLPLPGLPVDFTTDPPAAG